jgi:two-component system chemotaxis response regulator CheB
MTGMGTDGKLGLAVTKASGAVNIAQNEETCVVYGMPKVAIEAGLINIVAPLEKIAEVIVHTVRLKGPERVAEQKAPAGEENEGADR